MDPRQVIERLRDQALVVAEQLWDQIVFSRRDPGLRSLSHGLQGEEPRGEHFREEKRAGSGGEVRADQLAESHMGQPGHGGKDYGEIDLAAVGKDNSAKPVPGRQFLIQFGRGTVFQG
jgi:hypothetical protein